ncbi:MAG: type II secretion system protein N [Hydrogenophaga sp.]|jgi:general secretion pathway protein C|uniref:type II secretion system protein N n=1 Tax=Hydrogenophaga sp. TaxID=1904254 RepID=UPI001D59BB4D|nr:general secretion pathway protein C [Hydrogenophaga sp.]MBW0169075.1 general secretion pathway protein C [Hydrogenophaga sp.]MBW0185443.1 general secretion pathway protein C [Hydrogenophaga sp.]
MKQAPAFGHSGFLMESPAALQTAGRRGPTLAAAVLWLAAGLSAGYWVLMAWGRSPVTPVSAMAPAQPVADAGAVARTLGALPAAVAASNVTNAPPPRYILLGVVAVGAQDGAALIAVDGQPARPYRVGSPLDGGLVLQAVTRNAVKLGPAMDAPSTVQLSLPETAATRS